MAEFDLSLSKNEVASFLEQIQVPMSAPSVEFLTHIVVGIKE